MSDGRQEGLCPQLGWHRDSWSGAPSARLQLWRRERPVWEVSRALRVYLEPSSCHACSMGSPLDPGQPKQPAGSGPGAVSSPLLSHGCGSSEASETLHGLCRRSCREPSCSSACLDPATSPLSLLGKRKIILNVCMCVQGCIWPARAASA